MATSGGRANIALNQTYVLSAPDPNPVSTHGTRPACRFTPHGAVKPEQPLDSLPAAAEGTGAPAVPARAIQQHAASKTWLWLTIAISLLATRMWLARR
jgi:hypothetical protein